MSARPPASLSLDERRRRLAVRAWRRGLRELDLLFGGYADIHLAVMPEPDVGEFERLLDAPDAPMLAWMMGSEPPPADIDTPLFRRIRAIRGRGP